ncbi:HAD family hydrolase [Candidatus Woesearchaeota archaeon]|nr:HAD family hydrolase [Candidatus Woesearchaeota archaeon]
MEQRKLESIVGGSEIPLVWIFDGDGTLYDGSEVHKCGVIDAIVWAQKNFGLKLRNLTLDNIVEGQKGLTHEDFAKFLFENFNLNEIYKDKKSKQEVINKIAYKKERYVQQRADEVKIYEDAESILRMLKEAGCKIALFTSSDKLYTDNVLKKYGLEFDYVLDGDEIKQLGMESKPAPDGVYQILDELGINYEQKVAFVGDGLSDCRSAHAAKKDKVPNMFFIAYQPSNEVRSKIKENGLRVPIVESHTEIMDLYPGLKTRNMKT